MTQLFDTETYESADDTGEVLPTGRHLRSIPAGNVLSDRTTQWRLDQQTIEVGRKGLQAARQALQEAARELPGAPAGKGERKAA